MKVIPTEVTGLRLSLNFSTKLKMKKKIVAVNFEVIEDAEKDVKNLEFGPDFFFLNIHFYHYLSLLS